MIWPELFPLHGTCPLCGTPNLKLIDDVWVPPHPGKPSAWTELRKLAPGQFQENPDFCPIGRHTQAVEDGGIEVELHWLELLLRALDSQHRSDEPCSHLADVTCPDCGGFAERMRLHTDARRSLLRRWRHASPSDENLPRNIVCWRDREPILMRTLDCDVRRQHEEEVATMQAARPPWEETLGYMWEVLRVGTIIPASLDERLHLKILRRDKLVRRTNANKNEYQLAPFGLWVLGQHYKSHGDVAARINTFRFTHRNFDPCLTSYHSSSPASSQARIPASPHSSIS
jgi:hypothetical protein